MIIKVDSQEDAEENRAIIKKTKRRSIVRRIRKVKME
jgi:hypothetical protein